MEGLIESLRHCIRLRNGTEAFEFQLVGTLLWRCKPGRHKRGLVAGSSWLLVDGSSWLLVAGSSFYH